MKAKDIKNLSIDEIKVKLGEVREELLRLRLRKQTGQLEKPHQIRENKHTIARLETILREKQAVTA